MNDRHIYDIHMYVCIFMANFTQTSEEGIKLIPFQKKTVISEVRKLAQGYTLNE